MNSKKEKLLLENLVSSGDVFARCSSLLKPSYFDIEHRLVVAFLLEYYEQYRSLPSVDIIKAETDVELVERKVSKVEYDYTCNEIETFCRNAGMQDAIKHSSEELNKPIPSMGIIYEAIKAALAIGLPNDLGVEFFHDDIEYRLRTYIDTQDPLPTLIAGIDNYLDGGPRRKTLTLFSANSGVGKSVMLSNCGMNYARQGYNVLYISLELPQEMIDLRLAAIMTALPIKDWKENISQIAHIVRSAKDDGAGSYVIKALPNGCTANDIRSYLKMYELERGCMPDILIVDYLDLMTPNEGMRNMSLSEKDKATSEQVSNMLKEFDMVGLSASQQNREALTDNAPGQQVIAGGLTKVNTVDNYASLYMDPTMRLQGQMRIFWLKTRSSDGVGKSSELKFQPTNLIITDSDMPSGQIEIEPINKKFKPKRKSGDSDASDILAKLAKKVEDAKERVEPEKPTPAVTPTIPEYVRKEMDIMNAPPPLPPNIDGDMTELLKLIDRA